MSDALTVRPGHPVGYFGDPIASQPDPSKIVGVFVGEQARPELPPVPEVEGLYWARIADYPEAWTVVEVGHWTNLGKVQVILETIGRDYGCEVAEWGPKLEPPK